MNPSSASAFKEVLGAIFNVADYMCIGVIMYAGGSWMLGNRTKAIEHLVGGATGYLIVRNAPSLQMWLKGLTVR